MEHCGMNTDGYLLRIWNIVAWYRWIFIKNMEHCGMNTDGYLLRIWNIVA